MYEQEEETPVPMRIPYQQGKLTGGTQNLTREGGRKIKSIQLKFKKIILNKLGPRVVHIPTIMVDCTRHNLAPCMYVSNFSTSMYVPGFFGDIDACFPFLILF